MSLENNRKILIGSVSQSLDKLLVLGETSPVIPLLSVIIDYIEYSVAQYNAGNLEYRCRIDKLNKMVQKLKYQCPDVCIYKDRVIMVRPNNAPTIEDNLIELLISNEYQDLEYNDVVHNYNDADNDLINKVVILSLGDKNDLLIDSDPTIINNTYQPNIEFSAKYENAEGQIYFAKNKGGDPCVADIISLDGAQFQELSPQYNITDINSKGETVLQTVINGTQELPKDTIIYVHVDTSSLASADQDTIKEVVLEWWEGFQQDNLDFEGSLLINTVPNNEISDDFAPGREANARCTVPQIFRGGVERWVENPAEAFLRQAYKEGLPTAFNTVESFKDYIKNKSVVVLSFVDETHPEYHGSSPIGFNDLGQNIYQPTPQYITDFYDSKFQIVPNLKFFKGVLYPITRITNSTNNNFMLHSMAAIEGKILTRAEIDAFLGPDKVAAYGPANMEAIYYNFIGVENPYQNLGGIKELGWEGRWDKTSPASEVLTSEEFQQELNEILTSVENIPISTLDNVVIVSSNLGESVETTLSLKVQDNNPVQPLYSNEATVTLRYTTECEDTPNCNGKNSSISTEHKQTYVFTKADFISDNAVSKVKITSANIPSGQLKYFALNITSDNTPILISVEDIVSGNLVYTPDSSIQEAYSIQLGYVLGYPDSVNFCENENLITLTKLANPNTLPVVITENKELEIISPATTIDTVIDATVTYNGQGSYVQYWQRITGPNNPVILDPRLEDLELQGLIVGTYIYRLTVITDEDGFIATGNSTVTVTLKEPVVPIGPAYYQAAIGDCNDGIGENLSWQDVYIVRNGVFLNPGSGLNNIPIVGDKVYEDFQLTIPYNGRSTRLRFNLVADLTQPPQYLIVDSEFNIVGLNPL